MNMDRTHDPTRRSWVEAANATEAGFPLQNLPFGVFRPPEGDARAGVAIGDRILDVAGCLRDGLLTGEAAEACTGRTLNPLMALGSEHWRVLRGQLSALLSEDAGDRRAAGHLFPADACAMLLPVEIGDYTDFYASIHHATNVGRMLRPDNPLLPNYKYIPVGYHGRASSVVVSGTPVRRPRGQRRPDAAAPPEFGPCRMLDYECEAGCFVGPGNEPGTDIPIGEAGERIFGVCLVNDWSARDIQAWEYQPLGPFLSKSFSTSVSPWIVTMDALAPFRCPLSPRAAGDPEPLPYLDSPEDRLSGGIDLIVEVWLSSARMREQDRAPVRLSRGSLRDMYWTFAQMLAHHASNGCNLRPGDLLASGTISGAEPSSRGCLLELTARGAEPIALPGGETRAFLEDGDEVILRGWCEREGHRRIGLGECRGVTG